MTKKEKDHIFETEFVPYIEALMHFGHHLTKSISQSNDLVQDTLLRAYRFIDSYKKETNAKAWLFRILKNNFINDYRIKSKTPQKISYDDIANDKQLSQNKNTLHTIDFRSNELYHALGDEISTSLDSLPEKFKHVIVLSDLENFSYEEISDILDMPIGTVRSRLFRARNMLKTKLKTYADSLGIKDRRK